MERQQHDDLFQPLQIRRGPHANLFERIARFDFHNRADRKIAGKDAVHPAGNHALAVIHVVVIRNIFHDQQRLARTADWVLSAGIRQQRPNAAVLIGEKKNLRRIRICFDDFSDHAIRHDDSHVLLDAVPLAAIDVDGHAGRPRTGADHARAHHRDIHVQLSEVKKAGKAVGFGGLALQLRNLQL